MSDRAEQATNAYDEHCNAPAPSQAAEAAAKLWFSEPRTYLQREDAIQALAVIIAGTLPKTATTGDWKVEGQWVVEPSGFSYHMETERGAQDLVYGSGHPNSLGINSAINTATAQLREQNRLLREDHLAKKNESQ